MSQQQPFASARGPASGQWVPMAGWWRRVAAALIDQLLYVLAYLPNLIGVVVIMQSSENSTMFRGGTSLDWGDSEVQSLLLGFGLMLVGWVLVLVAFFWNRVVQQGRTGQSLGKSVMNIYLVGAGTGTPVGAGQAFVREIVHVVDGIAYLGYLWPLWDSRKQTFADKILGTVVAHAVPAAATGAAPARPIGSPVPQ